MKTQIFVEAEMTDEQCDALVSELKHTAEIIGIKLSVTTSIKSPCDFEHHNADIRRAYTCSECGGRELK
jgi:predicted Zn-ribbon and HTH transcriptional regulator